MMKLYKLFLRYPSVQTDSRQVKEGDLFFALKGPNFNGNAFAADALKRGAAYAIIDEEVYAVSNKYILEDNALEALQHLARYHRLQFNIPFIAITGSNGKTTTKELLTAVLNQQYKTYATEGNLNNHIGVPLSILKIKKDAEIAIIEMGANHLQEIALYCDIVLPNFGIITNCGKAHLEGFGSIEGVRKGKGELYDYIRKNQGTIFRNADLDYLLEMAAGIDDQKTYGSANAQVIGRTAGEHPFLNVAILSTGLECQISTQLVGAYNIANVLAAVAIGHYFEVEIEKIKSGIEQYEPSNSRSQLIQKGSNKIILDAYNANPSSMKAAIENFKKTEGENKWLLLGGMKELGKDSRKEHQSLIDLLNALNFQNVLLSGSEFKKCQHNFLWFQDAEELKQYLLKHTLNDATILIKGSRTSKMELTLTAL